MQSRIHSTKKKKEKNAPCNLVHFGSFFVYFSFIYFHSLSSIFVQFTLAASFTRRPCDTIAVLRASILRFCFPRGDRTRRTKKRTEPHEPFIATKNKTKKTHTHRETGTQERYMSECYVGWGRGGGGIERGEWHIPELGDRHHLPHGRW